MFALAQIDLTELPFRPPRLDDFELITVFISAEGLPDDTANGDGWSLRAYSDRGELIPVSTPPNKSHISALPMRPAVLEADFPCREDIPVEVPRELDDTYYNHFKTADGFKLGGWPSLVQSEIYWAPWNKHPAEPEYVFQIDSSVKANWQWGDAGVGYFGRGTAADATDEWTLAWQCY